MATAQYTLLCSKANCRGLRDVLDLQPHMPSYLNLVSPNMKVVKVILTAGVRKSDGL